MQTLEAHAPAPVPGVDDGGGIPSFGADLHTLRQRVLGSRKPGAQIAEEPDLTASENREVYEALRKRHQVDLNDEDNLPLLEDPTLRAHMDGARLRLRQHEEAMTVLPAAEALRTQYLKFMGNFSERLRGLEDEHLQFRTGVDEAHMISTSIEQLLAGQTPHGHTEGLPANVRANSSVKAVLVLLQKKTLASATVFEGTSDFLENHRNELFVLRREVEVVVDGLLKLCRQIDEYRRLQREMLLVVAPIYEAEERKNNAQRGMIEREVEARTMAVQENIPIATIMGPKEPASSPCAELQAARPEAVGGGPETITRADNVPVQTIGEENE